MTSLVALLVSSLSFGLAFCVRRASRKIGEAAKDAERWAAS